MEPSSPDPGVATPPGASAPDEATPAHGPAERLQEARVRRRRTLRQVLVVGLAVIALMCLGGGAAAFLLYDRATKPDLSTPALVTRKYLDAYLVDRDDAKAAQFQCADDSGLSDIRALRADIDSRQKTFGVNITVSVDRVSEVNRSGPSAATSADLVLSTVIQGQSQRAVEQWEFALHDEDGWRVCSGHEVT
jgi:hypothetical protein